MYVLNNEQETMNFGEKLGYLLLPGMVITLNGDLGSGKTTLTKAIARALDITEHIVSPTFTIVQEYEGRIALYHFDAYRIADEEEMLFIGFDEYLSRGGVCIIEWAEQIRGILPKERLDIFLHYAEDGGRRMEIMACGSDYEKLLEQLEEEKGLS